jgi:hypothetical protein
VGGDSGCLEDLSRRTGALTPGRRHGAFGKTFVG